METIILGAYAIGVPIIIFVVQAIKKVGMPTDAAPFLSLALGIGFVYLIGTGEANQPSLPTVLVQGALVGMAASGAYSGVKAATKKETDIETRVVPDDDL
jgi:hypothetical protein